MEEFISLITDYTFLMVAIGAGMLGLISGVLGSFATLKKQGLLGDGISHATLPGVVAIFLLTGSKNTEILLFGAAISGLIATGLILGITKNTKVKFDAALAVVLAVFFGLGLVLLTYSQKIPNANQAGLDRFIYGQVSAIIGRDLNIIFICGIFIIGMILLLWKELKLFAFDPVFGDTIGFSSKKLDVILALLLVLGIVVGLQMVGVILMSAMLIAPAIAARQWTDRLGIMVILSAIFGLVSGVVGTAISSGTVNMPTGPVIVVCVSSITIFSILFAPKRGVLHRLIQFSRQKREYRKGRN